WQKILDIWFANHFIKLTAEGQACVCAVASGEWVSGVDWDIAVLAEEGVVGVAEPSARRRRQPSQARTILAPTALAGRALAGGVAGVEVAEVVYVRRKPEIHHAECGSQIFAISVVSI
ncbi:unnamed protein product, partial [Musa acuminata var. zebrina]